MKKVLISAYNLDFGGIETSLINLLKNMDLNKYKVTLVLERKEGVFLNQVPKGIKVKEYKVSNNKNILIRKSINLLKKIKWIIFNYKKYSSSICYATYSKPGSFLARTASDNKILFVHSNYLNVYKKDIDKIKVFFDTRNILEYNKIIFVSNESKDDLIKIYPEINDKSYVINNLVDYEKIISLSKEKVNINNDYILFLGRLEEDSKKISRIIELAKEYKDKNIMFFIVGDGPDKKMYEGLIEKNKLNNVQILGSKKNPYPYIKKCKLLLLTSDYEGFPVVYNEAIALNVPIVSTIDVTDDCININNRFGYIADKNIKSIKEKVDMVLNGSFKNSEKIDFRKLNKKRMKLIEELLENEND